MTGGEAFRAKLLTSEQLDAAIAAYLADPSAPAILKIGDKRLDVAAAVLANAYSTEVLARDGVTPPQQRNAIKTAILLAPVA
ncbi:hypothetical protein SAMN02799631_04312 [Methylobacterium sp. 174MFSha1.1]|uniref:hypothetical protein n=1 Tax=Methylobacterium sp. 174MFSha1.1 TaxID=1502749 RepID=UPI0008F0F07C|nr:hypothetical protein [Methylobacterium sp. 174MFSha1.1]SFV05865.1 hypothetical protein SAMN02799631_04312 [Methylobacterium sp. 174MFSha1.1]